MPTRKPSKKKPRKSLERKPEYWDLNNPADRDEQIREVKEALNSEGPVEAPDPLPPFDPLVDWWDNQPKAAQRELAARAEDFSSLEEFVYKYLGKGKDFCPRGQVARHWINENLDALFADAKRMDADAEYAQGRIEAFLGRARGYLDIVFRVVRQAHRPVENVDKDREWSKLNYKGRTYEQIAQMHFDKTGDLLDATSIRTAVDRHRKRRQRQRLTMFIAHEIWSREFGTGRHEH